MKKKKWENLKREEKKKMERRFLKGQRLTLNWIVSFYLLFIVRSFQILLGCPRGVMVKAMDCGIVVSEFEFQSRYYDDFRVNTIWERYEPPYPPSYGLNSTTAVLLGE